ncbi:cytochrome P450, partial [Oryctes borbonicus]
DTQWREMRATLSPSFTSSKMKMIFTLISECANDFVNHFLEKGGSQILEMKDTFTRYTNDVIASVAFGIKCDSIRERDNLFFTMGTKATKFGPSATIKFLVYTIAPKLSKLLGITFFSREITQFFLNVVTQTIQTRESQGIVRPDMLNLLIEARKGKTISDLETNSPNRSAVTTSEDSNTNKHYLTDLDIAAQAMVFFFGGFESVATLMSFMTYELALNPECQKKLQTEIDETLKECNGQLTYEALMKMKYMDMVLSETLRKWPPAVISDRVCSKDYTIEPVHSHEQPIYLKTGDLVWIPIYGIHNDPKYYPEPEKFDPMRFSDYNKTNVINPYTYLPFGAGPRNCIGSRFALMETKTILFHMLSKFDFNVCEKTDVPIQLNKKAMQLITQNGVWIKLKARAG